MADPTLSLADLDAQIAALQRQRAQLVAREAGRVTAPTRTRVINKLTATAVQRLRERRLHSDGLGLYLDTRHLPARSWAFRFVIDGQRREMGLGPVSQVTLAQARVKRDEQR